MLWPPNHPTLNCPNGSRNQLSHLVQPDVRNIHGWRIGWVPGSFDQLAEVWSQRMHGGGGFTWRSCGCGTGEWSTDCRATAEFGSSGSWRWVRWVSGWEQGDDQRSPEPPGFEQPPWHHCQPQDIEWTLGSGDWAAETCHFRKQLVAASMPTSPWCSSHTCQSTPAGSHTPTPSSQVAWSVIHCHGWRSSGAASCLLPPAETPVHLGSFTIRSQELCQFGPGSNVSLRYAGCGLGAEGGRLEGALHRCHARLWGLCRLVRTWGAVGCSRIYPSKGGWDHLFR